MPDTKKSDKLVQFEEELNVLCKKYQYTIKPQLNYGKDGISAFISVFDVVPEKSVSVPPAIPATPEKKRRVDKHRTKA